MTMERKKLFLAAGLVVVLVFLGYVVVLTSQMYKEVVLAKHIVNQVLEGNMKFMGEVNTLSLRVGYLEDQLRQVQNFLLAPPILELEQPPR